MAPKQIFLNKTKPLGTLTQKKIYTKARFSKEIMNQDSNSKFNFRFNFVIDLTSLREQYQYLLFSTAGLRLPKKSQAILKTVLKTFKFGPNSFFTLPKTS